MKIEHNKIEQFEREICNIMNYSDEIKKTIASSRAFLKNISDDELEMLMQDFDDYEVEICNHYGVDYSKGLTKGVTFEISKEDEIKFINELIKKLDY